MDEERPPPLKISTIALRAPGADDSFRISALLWGNSGCGKTTLACTAPGHKLLMLFDSEGDKSLTSRSDVSVMDLTAERATTLGTHMMADDPYQMDRFLKDHPEFDTIVCDSMTEASERAMPYVVSQNKSDNMSLLAPGIAGYSRRNVVMKKFVSTMLSLTRRHNRHIIFTCHEGNADRDKQGNILSYPMTLSANLAQGIALQLSEIWYISESAGKKTIHVRPWQMRKLVKSRMFITSGSQTGFTWTYDPETDVGGKISEWFAAYKEAGGRKIPLPK